MELNKLSYTKGSRGHKTKTYGRGFGSGIGKTSGKGTKGQNARKSGGTRLGFEGGQTPIYRRLPKIGFNNINFANQYEVISTDLLTNLKGEKVDMDSLIKNHLVSKNCKFPLKLIAGKKEIKKAYTITVAKATAGAIKLVEKAGGKITIENKINKK